MPAPINVSDIRSNLNEQIVHAVRVIGRSKQRLAIFKAIYRGKKKIKTVKELCSVLANPDIRQREVRVLQMGGELATDQIVSQVKDKKTGRVAYAKIKFYSKHYKKIIKLVLNPEKIKKIPTKQRPLLDNIPIKILVQPKIKKNYKFITIDDIDSFKLVQKISNILPLAKKLPENKIKRGFQKIIRESGIFKDWAGEKNDLYSTKIKIKNKRFPVAIAFKGRGTKGKLTPEKMGKRADQIQRLFLSPAQVFLVVYNGQIDQSILAQMQVFALGKAMSGQKIYYGIIDGDDLNKLVQAYKKFFL